MASPSLCGLFPGEVILQLRVPELVNRTGPAEQPQPVGVVEETQQPQGKLSAT